MTLTLTNLIVLTTVVVFALIVLGVALGFRREDRIRLAYEDSMAAGLTEVASLHPVIDPAICISSGACVDACPEDVLGQVDGATYLVQANDCIGHGRCASSCPVDAIQLVIGTAKRGVDIPTLRQGYESNVDGIFVVGELGGMGLIRNAMRQGLTAIEALSGVLAEALEPDEETKDVLIVGAGPAGIAAALGCLENGLSFEVLDQYTLGGSVTHYPRRKLIFSETVKLPIVGRFGKPEMLKEELIAEFERITLQAGFGIREERRVVKVRGHMGSFRVHAETARGEEVYKARTVVLAIGRRGTPRKLSVPGEDLPHVVYRLIEAEQYRHRKVLVVGGGDSAVEAAVSIAQVAGSTVYLSYRGENFFRVKRKNREDLDHFAEEGRIRLLLETNVVQIREGETDVRRRNGQVLTLEVDDVIVNAGGVLPTQFLEAMGIEVETKRGDAAQTGDPTRALAKRIASTITRSKTSLGKTGAGRSGRLSSKRLRPGADSEPPSDDRS